MPPRLASCLQWYASLDAPAGEPDVCASRDVFQARLDTLLRQLLHGGWPDQEAALLVAVIGEVGNNSFDHNLGQWKDVPGCWFGGDPDHVPPLFWIADRGVGILATLRRADPALATPHEAIEAAFARTLSGRTPERRGNGLKFVRSVINGRATRGLVCQSGGASQEFGALCAPLAEARARLAGIQQAGVVVVVAWRPQR
ncbi:MAG: hypothetical protein HYY06_23385 [Deltaproteobacteria bacterium]|nr:hypothetical protein [Deltaproteobacteria bacterium]